MDELLDLPAEEVVETLLTEDWLEVSPAYGKDYKNKKEVEAGWHAGHDFQIQSYGPHMGRYINKQDATAGGSGVHGLVIRYGGGRKLHSIKV